MIYTVVWQPAARDELTRIWLESTDQTAITGASHTIDALLRIDPEHQGESRFGESRVLLVPPLGVDFDIAKADRLVLVGSVWRFSTH